MDSQCNPFLAPWFQSLKALTCAALESLVPPHVHLICTPNILFPLGNWSSKTSKHGSSSCPASRQQSSLCCLLTCCLHTQNKSPTTCVVCPNSPSLYQIDSIVCVHTPKSIPVQNVRILHTHNRNLQISILLNRVPEQLAGARQRLR